MRLHHCLFASITLLLLVSCKKDEAADDTPPPDPNAAYSIADFCDFGTGSYWVYARTNYDSLGNQTSTTAYDSLFIAGDSTVNGNVYKVYRKAVAGSEWSTVRMLWRDSADCIVDSYGQVFLRYGTFDQVGWTDHEPNVIHVEYTLSSTRVDEVVPAGVFSCYDWHVSFIDVLIPTLPEVPPSRYPYYRWVPGIGRVKQYESYAASGQGVIQELVRYHVE